MEYKIAKVITINKSATIFKRRDVGMSNSKMKWLMEKEVTTISTHFQSHLIKYTRDRIEAMVIERQLSRHLMLDPI